MTELPAGTVTFVFTDIEGSTELLKALGDEYADVLAAHRRIIRETFGATGGVEIDVQGDAFFFAFPRARDAVAAAVEAQKALAAQAWPRSLSVRVRMGLHTGEPAVHDEGYVGLDVVRAARICTLGSGGQILLSESTRALLGTGLPDGVSVFPLGQRQLRGIDEPERVYEIAIEELERAQAPAERETAAVPDVTAEQDLERDIAERFERLGGKLAAGIQQRVLQALEGKSGTTAEAGVDASAADDIAARMASLGDEIEARIEAAFAKKRQRSDGS